jgi:hypothetical protein
LGIPTETIKAKQSQSFAFLDDAADDPITEFRFLSSINESDLAEKLLIDDSEAVIKQVRRLVGLEYDEMLNKREGQKWRILIPCSRLLFGICDPRDILKPDECYVRVTQNGDGIPLAIAGGYVLVTRNPCLHPGDLRELKAIDRPELGHLSDCIVFSTEVRIPNADTLSIGYLDGDTCEHTSQDKGCN